MVSVWNRVEIWDRLWVKDRPQVGVKVWVRVIVSVWNRVEIWGRLWVWVKDTAQVRVKVWVRVKACDRVWFKCCILNIGFFVITLVNLIFNIIVISAFFMIGFHNKCINHYSR